MKVILKLFSFVYDTYEAKKLGVQSAMPLYKAVKLCPNLILKTVDRKFYSKMSHLVMEILEGYADSFEQASIDEAFLDCTNKIISFSGNTTNLAIVEEYSLEIKKTIKAKCSGLLTSIGVAPTKIRCKNCIRLSETRRPNYYIS